MVKAVSYTHLDVYKRQQLDGYPCIFQDDYKAAVNLTEQMVKTGKKFGYITAVSYTHLLHEISWAVKRERAQTFS